MKKSSIILIEFSIFVLILLQLNSCRKRQSYESNSPKTFKILNHPLEKEGKFVLYYMNALKCSGYGNMFIENLGLSKDSVFLLDSDLNLIMIDSSLGKVKLSYFLFKDGKLVYPFENTDYYSSAIFKGDTLVNVVIGRFVMEISENELFNSINDSKVMHCLEENEAHINPWFYQQMKNFKGEIPFQTDKALIRE